ncbi:MAG: hypothetical protein Kow0062_27910 [Acidobacteriota bacterium]|nr:MAG: AtpZ/AtpI family protein [Acidobacteriota bacterium]
MPADDRPRTHTERSRRRGPRPAGSEPEEPVAGRGGSASIRRSAEDTDDTAGARLARALKQAAPFLGAAWTLTAALLAGALGGRWLDGRLGTGPWLTLAGIVLGLLVGFYELARVAFPGRPERPDDGNGKRRRR